MYPKRLLNLFLLPTLLLVTLSSIPAVAIRRAAINQHAVFIPLVTSKPSTPATPPPPAGEVVARGFINTSYYELGDHQMFGEVINNLDVPVYSVELIVTYRNAAGRIVAMDTASAALPRIEPNSSSPFTNRLSGINVPPDIKSLTVEVKDWLTEGPYLPVTILSTKAYLGSGVITVVEGEARNPTDQVVWYPALVISFRNTAGEVVQIGYEYPVGGAVQPGETFKYKYESAFSELANYTAVVQGSSIP